MEDLSQQNTTASECWDRCPRRASTPSGGYTSRLLGGDTEHLLQFSTVQYTQSTMYTTCASPKTTYELPANTLPPWIAEACVEHLTQQILTPRQLGPMPRGERHLTWRIYIEFRAPTHCTLEAPTLYIDFPRPLPRCHLNSKHPL